MAFESPFFTSSSYLLNDPKKKFISGNPFGRYSVSVHITLATCLNTPHHKRDLTSLIRACIKGERQSQETLYRLFFPYAMGICLRYSRDREEAAEILNDGFLKVFTRLEQAKNLDSLKSWIRKIMIHSAIDYYRKHQKHHNHLDIVSIKLESPSADSLSMLSSQEILSMVQKLPPSYRMAFVLYAIEGFKHEEIAEKLDISVGTSKSNLAKARAKLRKMLASVDQENYEQYG